MIYLSVIAFVNFARRSFECVIRDTAHFPRRYPRHANGRQSQGKDALRVPQFVERGGTVNMYIRENATQVRG